MVFSRAQSAYHGIIGAGIAKPYGEIPQPTLITDAPNRRTLGSFEKFTFRPREQFDEFRFIQLMARREIFFHSAVREFVLWANQITIVAAEYPVAHGLAEFFRNAGA